jgi:hypothetical protein
MALTTFSGPVRSLNGFIAGNGNTITKVLSGSASLDFGSITAAAQANLTITVTGAAVGDEVIHGFARCPCRWSDLQRVCLGCQYRDHPRIQYYSPSC